MFGVIGFIVVCMLLLYLSIGCIFFLVASIYLDSKKDITYSLAYSGVNIVLWWLLISNAPFKIVTGGV